MNARWLIRGLSRLVPHAWREAIAEDLQTEAAGGRRSVAWIAWHTVRAAVPLRLATLADLVATDVRHTVRSLRRSPAFAAAAVLSFALGSGANVALLSVVDRLVFRPLPFPEADRLLVMSTATDTADRMLFHAHAVAIQEQATTIDGFGIAYGAGQGQVFEELGDAPVFLGSLRPICWACSASALRWAGTSRHPTDATTRRRGSC